MRRRRLRQTGEGNQEPMELDWLSTEPSDQDMSDQGRSSQELPDEGPPDESISIDSSQLIADLLKQ